MSAIGVGDFVEYVGREIENLPKRGYVGVVTIMDDDADACFLCGDEGPGFQVSGTLDTPNWYWCACEWHPYHGPEQAKRLVCEEIDA